MATHRQHTPEQVRRDLAIQVQAEPDAGGVGCMQASSDGSEIASSSSAELLSGPAETDCERCSS